MPVLVQWSPWGICTCCCGWRLAMALRRSSCCLWATLVPRARTQNCLLQMPLTCSGRLSTQRSASHRKACSREQLGPEWASGSDRNGCVLMREQWKLHSDAWLHGDLFHVGLGCQDAVLQSLVEGVEGVLEGQVLCLCVERLPGQHVRWDDGSVRVYLTCDSNPQCRLLAQFQRNHLVTGPSPSSRPEPSTECVFDGAHLEASWTRCRRASALKPPACLPVPGHTFLGRLSPPAQCTAGCVCVLPCRCDWD